MKKMAGLASAFTGCPIGFAAPAPGRGVGAWRFVARYRSGTVAGSHGLPCFRDDGKSGGRLSGFKELRGMVRAGKNESIDKSSHLDMLMR
jgi:hypothetical protein